MIHAGGADRDGEQRWAEEHHRISRREGGRYPSDLRDAQWAALEPLNREALPGGGPRKTDIRAAIKGISDSFRKLVRYYTDAYFCSMTQTPFQASDGGLSR